MTEHGIKKRARQATDPGAGCRTHPTSLVGVQLCQHSSIESLHVPECIVPARCPHISNIPGFLFMLAQCAASSHVCSLPDTHANIQDSHVNLSAPEEAAPRCLVIGPLCGVSSLTNTIVTGAALTPTRTCRAFNSIFMMSVKPSSSSTVPFCRCFSLHREHTHWRVLH